MKNFFSLLIALSLTTNAFSGAAKPPSEIVDDIYSPQADANLKISPTPASGCSVRKSSRMFGNSQRNLLKVFENVNCDSASKEILGDALEEVQCKMLNQCETPITKIESENIFFGVTDLIIRENVKSEVAQYKSVESKNLIDLMAFADKMPDEYKKQIHFCPKFNQGPEKCLNENVFDSLAKTYISTFYSQNEAKSISKRSAAIPNNNWKTGFSQRFDAYRSAKIGEAVKMDNSTASDFDGLIKLDGEWKEKLKSESNSFEPADDKLLDAIVSSVINEVSTLPQAEMKERVKKAVLNYSLDGNDLIISHPNARAILDAEFDNLKLDSKDITSIDRTSLAKKINQMRVNVANRILNDECSQRVVSVAQMCAKLSDELKAGQVDGKSVNDNNLYQKIIDWNTEKSTTDDQKIRDDALGKIVLFLRMQQAKDNVYKRYINLLFNTNFCKEKYPSLMSSNQISSNSVNEFLASAENSARESRKNAYKEIVETVNKNEDLRREFAQSGYKFEGIKTVSSGFELPKSEMAERHSSPASETITTQKTFENTAPMANNSIPINTPQPRSYDVVNNFPTQTPDESIKNADNSGNDALIERLRALEKKESSLRKKMAASSAGDMQDTAASDELTALRKQIDDLKKEKSKQTGGNVAERSSDSADRAKDLGATSGSSASARGERLAARNPFSDKDLVDSAAAVAQQSRTPGIADSADYRAEASNAQNAARGPASLAQNASGGPGKNAGEKNAEGLTLTKTGEGGVDPSTILENPNEKDIALYFERFKGGSFIIRENGELVKVSPVLDAKGKPVLTSDGKMKFKKIKLSKAQQELIVKEINVNKAAKEVGVEPVRLFKLKSLLKEVRRE